MEIKQDLLMLEVGSVSAMLQEVKQKLSESNTIHEYLKSLENKCVVLTVLCLKCVSTFIILLTSEMFL